MACITINAWTASARFAGGTVVWRSSSNVGTLCYFIGGNVHRSLVQYHRSTVEHRKGNKDIVVVGTGIAARAALQILEQEARQRIVVVGKSMEPARSLLKGKEFTTPLDNLRKLTYPSAVAGLST